METKKPVISEVLNQQQQHWENTFSNKPDMFGTEPSQSAIKALEIFRKEGITKITELGAGQGRDTIYFAQNGLQVFAFDYSENAINAITEKAKSLGLSHLITGITHDVRKPFPCPDESVGGCYSHMLFCMPLTTAELQFLSSEIRRILKPNGINIYTVRNTTDPHYKTGIHRGEDMYEVSGFIVHFFSKEKINALANGFVVVSIDEFEEGGLPRKLFRVTLKKV
jgi:SAM-dependent methyltransferase